MDLKQKSPSKSIYLIPNDKIVPKLFAANLKSASMVWAFGVAKEKDAKDGKAGNVQAKYGFCLQPRGLCLQTNKQITLPGNGQMQI